MCARAGIRSGVATAGIGTTVITRRGDTTITGGACGHRWWSFTPAVIAGRAIIITVDTIAMMIGAAVAPRVTVTGQTTMVIAIAIAISFGRAIPGRIVSARLCAANRSASRVAQIRVARIHGAAR